MATNRESTNAAVRQLAAVLRAIPRSSDADSVLDALPPEHQLTRSQKTCIPVIVSKTIHYYLFQNIAGYFGGMLC